MRMRNFWSQNGPFLQMRIYSENLLMRLASFIHACLHAKKQSILKSHWPRAIFGYNLRNRFFPSMQFLHNVNEPKNFHFTQIPGKNNDVIFLKSPKTGFLTIFCHFT